MDLEQIFDSMENKVRDIRDELRFSIRYGIDSVSEKAKLIRTEETPEKVMSYFRKRKIAVDGDMKYDSFKNSMTNRLNPESIEEIFFGMYSLNGLFIPRDVPMRIIKPFSETPRWGKWALLCLFNGIYAYHTSKKFQYSENTLYGNTRQLIINGADNIKIRNRKYEKSLFLPYEQEMKNSLHISTTQMKKYISDPTPGKIINPDLNLKNHDHLPLDARMNMKLSGGGGMGGGHGCLF